MQNILRKIALLGNFNLWFGKISIFIASCFIALMTSIVIIGVFFRYVLNNSLPWVEDISLIMMVTIAFIIAPFAYRNGANVSIALLIETLPQIAQRFLRLMINILILWIIYRYFLESFKLIERGWSIRVNSIPISWAIPYLIVPVTFLAMALVAIELISRDIWGLINNSTDADLAPSQQEKME